MTDITENACGSSARIRVAIIGAGISGLAVANGLLNDDADRFDVQVYERDSIAFSSERGGYQIRIAANGLQGLKDVANIDLWNALREAWAGDESRAPAVVEPKDFKIMMELAKLKAYPPSRPVPRTGLRKALLQRPLAESRVHFEHKFERYEHTSDSNGDLTIQFNDSQSVKADILIAADGSNSRINRQAGLNNKVKLSSWTLLQSRANISEATRQKLPEALLKSGSLLFLGGREATGFASIYDPGLEDGTATEKTWNLFWSILIPSSRGEAILAKASGDSDITISLLLDYLRRDLSYGESLPTIINAATTYFRTGQLTSSAKPTEDWRKGIASHSRIILLGDAVHPMTPGRGQGANQALTDAGNLVKLFKTTTFAKGSAIEKDLSALVRVFDEEMYGRAFKMVKNSEQVTDVDLTSVGGKTLLYVVRTVLTLVGWGMTILESVGLKKVEPFDFDVL